MGKNVNQYIAFCYKKKSFCYDKLNQYILNYLPNDLNKKIDKKLLKTGFVLKIFPGLFLHPVDLPLFIHLFTFLMLLFFLGFSIFTFTNNLNNIHFSFSYKWILELLLLPPILFLSLLLHEFGHCLSGFTSGGFVAEIGIKKDLKTPFITKTFFMGKGRKRWIYYLGGINVNIFFSSLALLLFAYFFMPFLLYISILNAIIFFVNIIPNKKNQNDGFKIFSRRFKNDYDY